MPEYIEREKAQDGLDNIDWYHVNNTGQLVPGGKSDIETYVPFKAVEEMLKSIPAADAIEELQKRVPPVPHGRLIDADALEALFWDGQCYFTENIKYKIKNIETIFPAEEGE